MANQRVSMQDARSLFTALVWARIVGEMAKALQAGPGGLCDKKQNEGQEKPQAGPSGLRDKEQKAVGNDERLETMKVMAQMMVDEHEFGEKAMVAFRVGQGEKEKAEAA